MGRFGFGKKDQDGEEDSSRLALFGSRSKSKSPAPAGGNPYASAAAVTRPDPYSQAQNASGFDPYQQNQTSPQSQPVRYGGVQNPPQQYNPSNGYGASQNGYPQNPSFRKEETKSNLQNGYSANKYGNEGGYGGGEAGSNPYGGRNQNGTSSRPGGYGGLGRTNTSDSTDTDVKRDELFGSARDRAYKRPQDAPPDYQYGSKTGAGTQTGYGAYGERQLTAEEEEEEDIQAMKQDIKQMKQEDVASSRRTIQTATNAIETARNTLNLLGGQTERMINTERTIDTAGGQMRIAENQTDKLKRLNNTPFFLPAFAGSKSKRHEKEVEEELEARELDKLKSEERRKDSYGVKQRMAQHSKAADAARQGATRVSLVNRAKYQFEGDSDDDRIEDELEANTEETFQLVHTMKHLGIAMGEEINRQNKIIDKIAQKSDALDTDVARQTERLKRIH